MSPIALVQASKDRVQTYDEIGQELKRRYGVTARLELVMRGGLIAPIFAAFVIVLKEEAEIVQHLLKDELAQLEWWQSDHVLVGFGSGAEAQDAVDRAMACARRGQLERCQVTLWKDRMAGKFFAFVRSPRGRNYQPTGPLIPARVLAEHR
jgi:hypothetical protein